MTKAVTPPEPENEINLREALETRYLAYALSTIMHRALPDVRDGLKPVHRRVLFAMRQLRLEPGQGFKKSARVVGDVIGRYHPHGDQSVYDALVRLAQDFSVRYPLVDGQGNFGNVDGDNAAAMRYTEARLTAVSALLLDGLDEDTVDFRETYDGEDREPMVLPGAFPQLLANGAAGIAVGMATSIPPHNAAELCDAALHLIKYPNARTEKLVSFVQGPDFPTGGTIVEPREAIVEAYETGRGGFRVRAKWEIEKLPRDMWQIVVTEIPYQVQKSKLVEKMAELLQARKLPLLEDVRDESAEEIRLVLVPKSKMVEPDHLMESLFRSTDLENRFPLNLNVLSAGQVPGVMNLREALRAWLEHRKEVLVRRSNFRLDKIEKRLEVLEGYLKAYLNLDEVIRIIREEDEPKPALIKRFKLTDNQAEAILNMRLRSLRKLEEMEIKGEHKELTAEQKQLKALVRSDNQQWARVADEIKEVKNTFGPKTKLGARRTQFSDAPKIEFVPVEAMIEKEPITVVCSKKGWIRTMKGHVGPDTEIKFKEGDGPRFMLHAETTDKILLFATDGRFYTLEATKLPGGRGNGEPVRLMIDLDESREVVELFVHQPGRKLIVASHEGNGFIVPEDEVVAMRRAGKQVLNVSGTDEAIACAVVQGDHVAVIGDNRKLLIFPIKEVNEMTRGKGVRLQRYKDGGLGDVKTFTLKQGLIAYDRSDRARTFEGLKDWVGARAQAGRLPPKGFPVGHKFGGKFGAA
ncbi:DNA topoisomerase IV subunit A [Parvibaculum sp.]|jgi:topoisomerase-4 subunit A|uniref:DNA topoisomerase IV subunit A n=1 Tax=Parvibaculum sp. TaxID=2024848 RepID=UPI001B13C8D1|nr:DNA topoisomerase IV subunit A [Parvibaculum sp.]MBO6633429.1 DNA topoisomerase IV subunit A [Parvibaculum sp.]MBO6680201.1 DNA topoisomerase IV subunit A [Parvibaculum sp.]MBO6685495.1 DNA topoisomerase IV subunit A [Parvibaculum sp.]MBO6903496.1 DNA topoisomerase IV subunit A [Parvibaculum sp.]